MALVFRLAVVALCIVGVLGQLDQAMKDHILKLHNDYRSQQHSSNMGKLEWDPALEAKASAWAGRCVYKHSGRGENMAYRAGYPHMDQTEKQRVEGAMQAFYDEIKRYRYGTQSCGPSNSCHYLQIVWAKTTKVGCATKICNRLGNINWADKAWFIVCNFDPVGNTIGEYPFLKGAACSKCGEGATCENGLCVGGSGYCEDEHDDCSDWASRGECKSNPKYMLSNCCKSCKKGGSGGSARSGGSCKDSNAQCSSWAQRGECRNNPGWMLKNCKKSCKKC